MDNPQHYQPLSYALHPPSLSTTPRPGSAPSQNPSREEEEDEEENLVIVADHLNPNDHASDSSTNKPVGTANTPQEHQFLQEPDPGGKRRPGRPRGSKNRKVQSPSSLQVAPTKLDTTVVHSTGAGTSPPQLPNVNSQNQQYYEFQWRMLNLCAEFYGAAEELVKGTPPLVVAQCYQMGASKVDPLIMLNDAKRICDTLLAHPTQLILSPPPPQYPAVPTFYHPQPASDTSAAPKASTSAPNPTPVHAPASSPSASLPAPAPAPIPAPPPSTVITNPGSFVVSLGTQPTTSYSYAGYASAAGQYPSPYYTPYAYAPGYYAPQPQSQPQAQPPAKAQPPPPQASTSTPPVAPSASNAGTLGPWSEEEVERLKKLAEDSKAATASKEIEWDWVVGQWGTGRTRHQILLKATYLGLKESSGRGNKRRREADESRTPTGPAPPPNPAGANSKITTSTSTPSNTTGSPAMSHSTSTPHASPAMSHVQRPPSANRLPAPPKQTSTASGLPWPMPTVAAANVSPVLSPSVQGDQRTSYYRPRPAAIDTSGTAGRTNNHQFMYQNGPVPNKSS
ncbi:hypothetical protein B0H12DRAFT_1140563 [Mycena haematopus]|nr:hypothetical protein B0H12DRAFT_1140563 [Mycena haematopus]